MKKYTIKYCDDCPWMRGMYDKIDGVKIYKCSHPKIRNNNEDELLYTADISIPDIPIIIPEWCPLKDY